MTAGSVGEPRVSIIIPTYNRQQYIAKAIESALLQGANVEVIVVDDGSTDSSPAVISSFANVRSLRTANAGPSAARNAGLKAARARYVRFLDSDDLLPKDSTARLLAASRERSGREIVFGDVRVIDASGKPASGVSYGYNELPPGLISRATLLSRSMQVWLPLWPTSALCEAGGFNEKLWIGEDYELAAKTSLLDYQFVHVTEPTYEVREHDDYRLSRRYGAAGYRAHLDMFECVGAAINGAASSEERQAIGRMAWSLGRAAARERLRPESENLFAFARRVAGKRAFNAPSPVKLAYAVASPFTVERVAEAVKRLVPGLSVGPAR